ncbi:hypothetical protein [Streptomyces chartreusis]|uniref:hypothetical protein n=1 Tax=Streptomyces chartreusis TaxID=1969 RepID=UPI0036417166
MPCADDRPFAVVPGPTPNGPYGPGNGGNPYGPPPPNPNPYPNPYPWPAARPSRARGPPPRRFVGSSGVMESKNPWLVVPVALITTAAVFWGLPFLLLASLYSARSAFNTAHVHPMLPPVVTGILVWLLAIFNLISEGTPAGRRWPGSARCWAARCR